MTLPLVDGPHPSTGSDILPGWIFAKTQATGEIAHQRQRQVSAPGKARESGTAGSFDYAWNLLKFDATAGAGSCVRTIQSLQLERAIIREQASSIVEEDSRAFAEAAVRDALTTVRRLDLRGATNVMISEDGILSLQWQLGEIGAAIVFTGDGKVSISVASPGTFYSHNAQQLSVAEPFPAGFVSRLKNLNAMREP
jgi:hypothetical protein